MAHKEKEEFDPGGLLMLLESIAREKDMPAQQVRDIFAESLAQSAKRSADDARDGEFRAEINDAGEIVLFRRWRVLADDELMENRHGEIMLESAQEMNKTAQPGDIIEKCVAKMKKPVKEKAGKPGKVEKNMLDIRSCVHSAKQHFAQLLREADRQRLLDELLARNEELVNGQVLRVLRDTGDAIVEVLRLECRLPKSQMIPREAIKSGDRLQALIKEVNSDSPGQAVLLTRTSPEFLKLLFKRVVPEIEKGILEIINAVRDPGNRAKISVRSNDARVDPVGTCVGIRGSRVQAVTNELNGERIDIIPWDDDPANLVLRALAPAEINRIEVDNAKHSMDVLVAPDRMAQAIGKNGVNVRLASDLSGWRLNLHTIPEYEAEEQEKMREKSAALAQALSLEEDAARILLEEGFETMEHVAFAEESELLEVSGLPPEAVRELQIRAREQVEKEESELAQKMERQEPELAELIADGELMQALAKNDIFSLSDFAGLAADEFLDIADINEERAGELIMRAREVVYGFGDADEETA
ncbi:MAG: transcription termination factor NusA [Gammaproteobacteria bacterium]